MPFCSDLGYVKREGPRIITLPTLPLYPLPRRGEQGRAGSQLAAGWVPKDLRLILTLLPPETHP